MRSAARLDDEFSAALQFPSYFGENWAAFDECLADLGWLPPEAGYVVVMTEPLLVLDDSPADFDVLVRTLTSVIEQWATPIEAGEWWDRPAVPFNVVLATDPASAEPVRERWAGLARSLLTSTEHPLLRPTARVLIGWVASLEGEVMGDGVSEALERKLRRRLVDADLLGEAADEREGARRQPTSITVLGSPSASTPSRQSPPYRTRCGGARTSASAARCARTIEVRASARRDRSCLPQDGDRATDLVRVVTIPTTTATIRSSASSQDPSRCRSTARPCRCRGDLADGHPAGSASTDAEYGCLARC
jgi:hypothetical protein